jgi:hypothetical protein
MKKLSAYTIAKNCSDIEDCQQGINELNEYFEKVKNPRDSTYIRYFKLYEKLKKLQK